jgi:uncharacterized FlaG/YvyC family protein
MSDEMAEKKETELKQEATEVKQVETDQQKAQADQQKRLWLATLILDPETGEFAIQPNANVRKSWQLDALLTAAQKQIELTAYSRTVGELVVKIIEAKKSKGIFGGK